MMTTKGVTFNVSKDDQKAQYDFAMSKGNFSGYVKDLIKRDMESQQRRQIKSPPNSGGIKFSL